MPTCCLVFISSFSLKRKIQTAPHILLSSYKSLDPFFGQLLHIKITQTTKYVLKLAMSKHTTPLTNYRYARHPMIISQAHYFLLFLSKFQDNILIKHILNGRKREMFTFEHKVTRNYTCRDPSPRGRGTEHNLLAEVDCWALESVLFDIVAPS